MARKFKIFSKFQNEILQSGLLARLSNSALRIYLVLLSYSDWEAGWSYPSVKTISRDSGLHKNRISKGTEELVSAGLIKKYREGKELSFRNTYRIIQNPQIDRNKISPAPKRPCRFLKGADGKFKSVRSESAPVPQDAEVTVPPKADKN